MKKIDQRWFSDFALGDPLIAFKNYEEWREARNPTDEAHLRKALECASEKSRPAISLYRNGKRSKFSSRTLVQLDTMAASLTANPDATPDSLSRPERRRGPTRIALLTEFTALPNIRFHFDILRGLVQAAWAHHGVIATHEIPITQQHEETARVLRIYNPDAVIYLRLAPTQECLELLHRYGVAAVLVHSDEFTGTSAPSPILANIVANHRSITGALRGHVLQFLDEQSAVKTDARKSKRKDFEVVILAMKPKEGSLRWQRVDSIKCAFHNLSNISVKVALVRDYGFQHALPIVQQYPDALVYCCLSDELAVGVSHFFKARQNDIDSGSDAKRLIIGYDDSQLSKDEGITSFGQHLNEVGRIAMDQITEWLRAGGNVNEINFRLIERDVYLAIRSSSLD